MYIVLGVTCILWNLLMHQSSQYFGFKFSLSSRCYNFSCCDFVVAEWRYDGFGCGSWGLWICVHGILHCNLRREGVFFFSRSVFTRRWRWAPQVLTRGPYVLDGIRTNLSFHCDFFCSSSSLILRWVCLICLFAIQQGMKLS